MATFHILTEAGESLKTEDFVDFIVYDYSTADVFHNVEAIDTAHRYWKNYRSKALRPWQHRP